MVINFHMLDVLKHEVIKSFTCLSPDFRLLLMEETVVSKYYLLVTRLHTVGL